MLQKRQGSRDNIQNVFELYANLKKADKCCTIKRIEIFHPREYTSLQSGNHHFNTTDLKIFVAKIRW